MKRKMLSLLLCCAMFLSLSLPAMATDTASEEKAQLAEQFSEAYMEKLLEYSACDELMSDAESEQILNRFSDEIKYISSRADCEIQTIDHAALEKIKSVITAERLEYEPAYSELLTEIANAAMRQKMLVAENEISLLSGIDTGFEIRNHKTKDLTSNMPLRAELSEYLPINVSSSETVTVNIAAGTVLEGFSLTVGTSGSKTKTFTGPSANQWLHSGVAYATHAAGYVVLSGILQKVSYDVVETSTGNVISHVVQIVINEETKTITDYTLFVALGNLTYADHVRYNTTLSFANQSAFERNARNSPDVFVN